MLKSSLENYDKSVGYFVEPTVIVTTNPHYYYGNRIIRTSNIFVYEDAKWEETLELLDYFTICFNGSCFQPGSLCN
jgi:hypothetical protein